MNYLYEQQRYVQQQAAELRDYLSDLNGWLAEEKSQVSSNLGAPRLASAAVDVENIRLQGNTLFQNGKYAEAIVMYTDGIAVKPSIALYSNRALCYWNLQKYEESLRDAKQCLRLDPNCIKALFRKGCALVKLDKLDAAKVDFEKCLTLIRSNAVVDTQLEALIETELKSVIDTQLAEREIANAAKRKRICTVIPTWCQARLERAPMIPLVIEGMPHLSLNKDSPSVEVAAKESYTKYIPRSIRTRSN